MWPVHGGWLGLSPKAEGWDQKTPSEWVVVQTTRLYVIFISASNLGLRIAGAQ